MSPRQRTIAREVTLEGYGVHLGEAASITVRPAEPDSGIRFRRTDLDGHPEIAAVLDNVVDTRLGTTLAAGDAKAMTVEHVMAVLAAGEIDNAVIDLDGPEIPIRDGSFQDYVGMLSEAGAVEQDAPARVIELRDAVSWSGEEGQTYVAAPADTLTVAATIDFEHPSIGRMHGSFPIDPDRFGADLAPARTFGFMRDADELRSKGLALGASLDNTIVLDDEGVMNESLRFDDEYLRHKVGDVVGDLGLLGGRLRAYLAIERPSHAGNVALAKAIEEKGRMSGREAVVDITKIMEYLPHRYPMLLVDRITHFEAGKRIVGIKNVTINEPFFQGHYPGHPVMPGVLIVEAMAQVGGLLLMDRVENPEDKVVYFMSLDNVKWRRPVTPGDTLVFELEMLQFRRQICKMKGQGFVEGTLVAEAELMARIMDR